MDAIVALFKKNSMRNIFAGRGSPFTTHASSGIRSPGIAVAEAVVLGTDEFQTPHRSIGRGEAEELRRFLRPIAQPPGRSIGGHPLRQGVRCRSDRQHAHDPALRAAVEKVVRASC
jgi:hypothetical protein